MRKLWTIMTEMFGHRWVSHLGTHPTPLWSDACAGFTDEQFHRAVTKLKSSLDEWPPSLPEFRRWAMGGMNRDEAKAYAARRAAEEVERRSQVYNPHCAGMTYAEAERLQQRLERQYFSEATGADQAGNLAIEQARNADTRIGHDGAA